MQNINFTSSTIELPRSLYIYYGGKCIEINKYFGMPAIELTSAPTSIINQIRRSLRAVGVSGDNAFTLNGNMIGTGSIFLTAGGNDVGLHVPNGGIFIGYSAGGGWGNSNDGGEIRFHNPLNDDGELRIETRDNGNEAIVFRMRDEIGGINYEPLVLGKDKNLGINAPLGLRTFPSALTVYGDISASGNIFVNSIISSTSSPLTIDVNTTVPVLTIRQRGSGDVLVAKTDLYPQLDSLRIGSNGTLVVGASSIERSLSFDAPWLNIVQRVDSNAPAMRFYKIGQNSGLFNSLQFYGTRGSSISEIVELSGGDILFRVRGFTADPTSLFYRGNAEFLAQLSPGKTIDSNNGRPSDFVFRNNPVGPVGGTRETVRITCDGNLGIGTSTPNEALTVVGEISATSHITTSGKFYGEGSSITNAVVTGKTIYVDANTGTDTRGTLSKYSAGSPFATIAAAVAASVTGDLVYVRAGTYNITSQINLNLKGNLFFETGATVQVFPGIVAFSYSQNSVPISILGYANFVLIAGTAGVLTMPSGNDATAVQFECNSISGPNSVIGTLFNCAIGVLSVDAKLIQMTTNFADSNATVFNITGSGKVTTRVPFVYCGVYLNGAGDANPGSPIGALARFNSDIWTLATFNTTAGMTLSAISTNFRIVNYNHAGGVRFNYTEDSTIEGHVFNGVRWGSESGLPNMTFASSVGTTNNKLFSLQSSNIFKGSFTNSLSASVPVNVSVQNSYATVPASANVTFKVGSFTVDPLVGRT